MGSKIADRYFRFKQLYADYGSTGYLLRHNPNCDVSINDNVNSPQISIGIDNFDKKYFDRPASTKYCKVNEIDKDTYDTYFNVSMEVFKDFVWDKAEYYLSKYTNSYRVVAFCEEPKKCISIYIGNDLDITELNINMFNSFKSRPSYRKDGIKISEEIFCHIFKESVKFIEDDCSYIVSRKEFWDNISKAIKGELFPISKNKTLVNYQQLTEQLDIKKKQIERQLIENDSDTKLQRAELRGEKNGINYAITAIQKFFKAHEII